MVEWQICELGQLRSWRIAKAKSPRNVEGLLISACNREGKAYKGLFLPNTTREDVSQLIEILKKF